ncbi:MAG: GH3 auxin-responsive promoter family protein [Planctomycetaceae bacterium]
MGILDRFRASLGAIPRAGLRREANHFLTATRDCRGEQRRVLQSLIALNGDSRFAVQRGLNEVRSAADLRNRIGVTSYEDYADPIEQMKRGNHRALLGSRNQLLMFSLSSGTTATSKFVPITRQFFSDYKRGWQIWGIRAFDDYPAMNARRILQLSSNHDRFRTPGGTPCGNISGLAAVMQRPIVKTMYTVPGTLGAVDNPDAKSYTTLRLALADDNIGLVMTANPSTLVQLAKLADDRREELIRDIADGTLAVRDVVPATVLQQLRRRFARRQPKRARELERIVDREGRLFPKDYWSRIEVAAVWTGGSAGAYLHSLRKYYGDVHVRDHGLSASEGRMTIPFSGGGSEGILDVTSHFFEFIPEEEYGDPNHNVLEAHELEAGRNYFILLTTSSGFYRYDICDVVQCTGFHNTTPMLEFLHKGAHISNVTGEKISESQVVQAVSLCARQMDVHLEHFTVTPVWGEPPRYRLLGERADFPSAQSAEEFVRLVDAGLQQINCEYRDKRRTGRLEAMSFLPLPEGTWQAFTTRRQRTLGGSLEQYKHPCLVPDMTFSERLVRECAGHAA